MADEPPEKVLEAIAEAVMDFHGIKIKVYQLSDGRRVVSSEDLETFFRLLSADHEA